MAIPFWDPGAIDADGNAPGITTLIPETPTGPIPDELSSWDFVFLNGLLAPGICRLEGGRHIPYDRKAALGNLIGQASLLVFDPVAFTLTLSLWTPAQFTRLQEDIIPQIMPAPGPNPEPRAVSIEHPALKLLGVSTVYFEGMSLPRMTIRGLMEFEFTCYEWRPPLPVTLKDVDSPLPQTNAPGAAQQTVTVTPPSAEGIEP